MPKPHLKLKTSQGIMTFKPQDLSAHLAVPVQFSCGFNGWLPIPTRLRKWAGKSPFTAS